jgi:hypothetical protein
MAVCLIHRHRGLAVLVRSYRFFSADLDHNCDHTALSRFA